jgi:hypothetical protein
MAVASLLFLQEIEVPEIGTSGLKGQEIEV